MNGTVPTQQLLPARAVHSMLDALVLVLIVLAALSIRPQFSRSQPSETARSGGIQAATPAVDLRSLDGAPAVRQVPAVDPPASRPLAPENRACRVRSIAITAS